MSSFGHRVFSFIFLPIGLRFSNKKNQTTGWTSCYPSWAASELPCMGLLALGFMVGAPPPPALCSSVARDPLSRCALDISTGTSQPHLGLNLCLSFRSSSHNLHWFSSSFLVEPRFNEVLTPRENRSTHGGNAVPGSCCFHEAEGPSATPWWRLAL